MIELLTILVLILVIFAAFLAFLSDKKKRMKAFAESTRKLAEYDKACKEYRKSPHAEARFDTQAKEDAYYQKLWDNHGGTKGVDAMKLDIITPVGPGHENLVHRAAGSINIAKEYSVGPFSEIDLIAVNDIKGEMGRSKARNAAVEDSKADWIFFLDADDLMHPLAFAHFDAYTNRDAVWGKIVEYKEGNLLERYQVPEIETLEQLLSHDPYLTLQMGHFVKAKIAKDTPFNEDMNTGEDWDYYLRIWKSDYDCIKVDAPFMCNSRGEHSTGPRSANGREWREVVEKLIEEAR